MKIGRWQLVLDLPTISIELNGLRPHRLRPKHDWFPDAELCRSLKLKQAFEYWSLGPIEIRRLLRRETDVK